MTVGSLQGMMATKKYILKDIYFNQNTNEASNVSF